MKKETKKAPTIRFRGFTDDWEQRKLGELVIIERGGSPRPIDAYITEAQDGLNWVKIGDAPEQGRYITHTKEKIKPSGLSKTRQVFPGDLILSNSMSFGKPYIMGITGCIHDGWLLIRNNQNVFDLKFLCQMLGTKQMLVQYRRLAAGSTVNNLNKELVANAIVKVPEITEQEQIGAFLENLDNVITLHQRKLDQLKTLKKYFLQNMFPAKGEKVPRIRFKGFTGDWEQRKLGDIAEIKTGPFGSVLHADDYVSDGIPIITTEHFKNGHLPIVKDGLPQVSTEDYKRLLSYVLNIGDIVFSRVGSIDINALVTQSQSQWLFSGRVLRVRIKNSDNAQFLHIALETTRVRKSIISRAVGQTMPSINTEILGATLIFMPKNVCEQEQIGGYFCNLDNLITLHQRKLNQLQTMKKFMLQNLFI
ncbi:restriction endonuclease subunit S [Megasphaera elsdenii]